MNSKKVLAITTLSVMSAFTLNAQFLGQNYGTSFYITGGYANIDQDNLQVFVPPSPDNDIKNHYVPMGAGFHYQMKGFMIGGELTMLKSGTMVKDLFGKNDEGITTRSKIMNATVNFGYAVVDMPNLKVYPMIGIGHARTDFNVTSEGDIPLSQLNGGEVAGNEYNLDARNFLLDFSVRMDYIWGKADDKGITKGFLDGIRVGYKYAIPNDNWRHSGGEVAGAPDFGPSGPYVLMAFGFGKSSKEKMGFCGHQKKQDADSVK